MTKLKEEVFWKNSGYRVRTALNTDISCDYLIVGGGITGVSLAYFLAKNGIKNVVLIEKHTIASGATGKAAGILTENAELDLRDMIENYGRRRGLSFFRGNAEALQVIKRIIVAENIDCDFEELSTMYVQLPHKTYNTVSTEYFAAKKENPSMKMISGDALRQKLNTLYIPHAIFTPNAALSVNPLKLTQNWIKVAEKKGVKVFENTFLRKTDDGVAVTSGGQIAFRKIIFATDYVYPTQNVKSIRSTILVSKPLSQKQLSETGLLQKKVVWNSKRDYEYFKLTADNRILAGFGGLITRKKDTMHGHHLPHYPHSGQIQSFMKKLFPSLNIRWQYLWSGTFGKAKKWNPHMSLDAKKIVVVGTGSQVISVMLGKYVADKLVGRPSTLDTFFD